MRATQMPPNILCFHPLRRPIIIFLHKMPFTHTRGSRQTPSPHSNAFCSRSSLIVSAETSSSYSELQGSFSHKSYTHALHTHKHTHKRMKYGLRGPVTEHNRTLSVECDNPIFIPFHSHEITISITSHAEPR